MPLTTLTTPRLILRPPRLEDTDAIYRGYATDPEVARYVIWTPHRDAEETRAFLTRFLGQGSLEGQYPWVITLRHRGVVIGAMHLRVTPPRAELGFNIARPYWHQGFGTESVRAVVEYALALPGVARVQAICHVDNVASARVLERVGMILEGRLAQYMVFPNLDRKPSDVLMFAATREGRAPADATGTKGQPAADSAG